MTKRRWITRAVSLVVVVGVTACHGLLEVSDPTLIQDRDIANAGGANSRRVDVIAGFSGDMGATIVDVGMFTDEQQYDLRLGAIPGLFGTLDRRDSQGYEAAANSGSDPHLGALDDIVVRTSLAIPAVHAYSPDSVKGDFLAQLFAMRGYAILQMAEDICSGFPINDVAPNNIPLYGAPYSTDSAIAYAIVYFDSALAVGRDSVAFLNLARVAKGRALLDLGKYAEAAAVVAPVPTDFAYITAPEFGNHAWSCPTCWRSRPRQAVGDNDGVNGLPFVSAQDPRVPTAFRAVRFTIPADSLYDQLKYPTSQTPIVVASGIEARLLEAEVALNAGDPTWIDILDTLRATAISPAMPSIAPVPTTPAAQVDLLYRERAFWLYLTGRRLGDLRRLIRNYGRGAETVFPTGNYLLGGTYQGATAIPFVLANEAQYNPHITAGCAVR